MSTETHPDHAANLKKLGEMIKDIKFAMLTTVDEEGALRSRPMAVQNTDGFDGTLWFFTKAAAPKVEQVDHDHKVNVSFSHPDDQSYVSISGQAELVRDEAKKEELWTPAMKAWFPKGHDDPDVGLLKVVADKAEYWDTPHSLVVHAIGFVKATVTGKPYHPGANEKVDL